MPVNNPDRRLWFATDMVSFGSTPDGATVDVQATLNRVLDTAAKRAAVDRDSWDRQLGGDGEKAAIPHTVDYARVAGDFILNIKSVLDNENVRLNEKSRIRLRVALHYGTYKPAAMGWGGTAPTQLTRLVDSRELRRTIKDHPDALVVLAVSKAVYDELIAAGETTLASDDFSDEIQVFGKKNEPKIIARFCTFDGRPPKVPKVGQPRKIAIAVVGTAAIAAVTAGLLFYHPWSRTPSEATTVRMSRDGPYRRGDSLIATMIAPHAQDTSSARTLQLKVSDDSSVPDQTLCTHDTSVDLQYQSGAWSAPTALRNLGQTSVPISAGQTKVPLRLQVTTDPGCEVDLQLTDVTSES